VFLQFFVNNSTNTITAPLMTQQNVYFFEHVSTKVPLASIHLVLSAELWHQRLGHPGLTQLDTINWMLSPSTVLASPQACILS
jgi:hypothetical protein